MSNSVTALDHRKGLIHILQMAYSGELAAAFAYAGHWRSLRNPQERAQIKQIETDEWEHREIVGSLLKELGASPQMWREIFMGAIGSVIFAACFISGWFFPMYFAGRLEKSNTKEYASAAYHAEHLNLTEFLLELKKMSLVEAEHEYFFRNIVTGHPLTPFLQRMFGWGPEPGQQRLNYADLAGQIRVAPVEKT